MGTFLFTMHTVLNSESEQIQILYAIFFILDFPISVIYITDIDNILDSFRQFFGGGDLWAMAFYPPLLIHGVLGSIWWYFLPKFFLPKRIGGIWPLRG